MRSRKQIVRRIISSLICLLLVVLINFFLPRVMPGNPVLMLTGQDENSFSQEQIQEYEKKLGLDKSVGEQLLVYLGNLVRGDLGYSYQNNIPVADLLAKRIPSTLMVAFPALVLSTGLAMLLGTLIGYRRGTRLDSAVTTGLIILHAVPTFLLAMVLVTVFSFQLDMFPLGGLASTGSTDHWLLGLLDRIWHLTLPVVTVALISMPGKYLVVRNSVASAKDEKYVVYAKARGLSTWRIEFIHVFKKCLSVLYFNGGVEFGVLDFRVYDCRGYFFDEWNGKFDL